MKKNILEIAKKHAEKIYAIKLNDYFTRDEDKKNPCIECLQKTLCNSCYFKK